MEPKVLIISPQVFPKPHSGAGMRGHFQAVHLSQRWPITLATETGIYTVVDGHFSRETAVSIPELSNGNAYLRSALFNTHYLFQKFNCRRWAIPDFDDFTHVIIHYPALLGLLEGRPRPRASIIFDTHNNEREYFETVAEQTTNPIKRTVIRRQAKVSERIIVREREAISATISVSESDRDWVQSLSADGVSHFVVPNNLFRSKPTVWSGRKSILYVGSLNVTMNLQALEWFTAKVWPAINEAVPEMEFIVAGRNPSPALISELRGIGAKVVANPVQLDALYEDAMYSLIPASSGSGGKIKVCEALAHGVPVLTTSHGLVGQPQAVKDCCVVRDRAEEWVDVIKTTVQQDYRSTGAWDREVRSALEASYFGNSIKQISEFIETVW